MKSERVGLSISAVLMCVAVVVMAPGCAGKRVASTTGDQSVSTKDKAIGEENVQEDQLASAQGTDSPSQRSTRGGTQTPLASESGSQLGRDGGVQTQGSTFSSDESSRTGIGLGDIYFDFDQYSIRKDAASVPDGNGKWVRTAAGKSVIIEGHCDERGTLAYNLVLGEKRAKAAKHYLENLGVSASRIQTTSYGEVRPFCKEHNEGCWEQNRRVHFVVQ